MRLRDMVDPHLFFCSTVKNQENFDYLFRLTPLCPRFFFSLFLLFVWDSVSFCCGEFLCVLRLKGIRAPKGICARASKFAGI
jgi:hypothetical protein